MTTYRLNLKRLDLNSQALAKAYGDAEVGK